MAWTTPLTAVANASLTAAQWNASVRDDLLTAAPALAANAGSWFVATGTNTIAERRILTQSIVTSQTTGSTSYTNLTTSGPAVTVTTGTQALVIVSSRLTVDTAGQTAYAMYAVSGATTIAGDDNGSLQHTPSNGGYNMRASAVYVESSLTGGSNTFTVQYRVTGGTGTWSARRLVVMGM
jgi:hypothetical protein